MSPALGAVERIRRTEQVIAYLRFAVITFNIALYFTMAPVDGRRDFAVVVAVLATIYSIITLLWRPSAQMSVRAAYISMTVDSILIGVWIWATGGFESPFHLLFYAHSAASIGRFGAYIGGASAFAGAVVYVGVAVLDGFDSGYKLGARVGYIFLISAMVGYVAEVARSSEREGALAEREAAAYRELDRLRTTFVSNISHELRTPLTVVRGAASTLVRNHAELAPEDRAALVEMIDRQSEDLGALVQDIIDAGSVEKGRLIVELGPADVERVAKDQVEMMEARTSRHIEYRGPGTGVSANCDARKIGNALRKVIDNALKFSPGDSVVTVEVFDDGDHVRIEVTDRGIGVPEDERDRIFDRFVQLDDSHTRSAEGTGIGLTIARAIIELHHGSILVESEPENGSTFVMRFPKQYSFPPLPGAPEETSAPA